MRAGTRVEGGGELEQARLSGDGGARAEGYGIEWGMRGTRKGKKVELLDRGRRRLTGDSSAARRPRGWRSGVDENIAKALLP